jgi:1-deoxy-D-xylulose-5-phosphate reductoisomerase
VPTLAAIDAGKTVLLANKESLVTCGRLFMDAVKQRGRVFCRSTANTTRFFRVYRNLFNRTWGTLTWSRMAFVYSAYRVWWPVP